MRSVALLFLFLAALTVVAAACLPDLPTATAPFDASRLPARGCGDGFVDFAADAGEQCDPGEAGVPGCTTGCKLDCEGGALDPVSGHCYFPLSKSASFAKASEACLTKAAHVVTLGSEEELAFVSARYPAPIWVGLAQNSTAAGAYTPPSNVRESGWPLPPATGPCPGCFAVADDAGIFPPEGPLDGGPSGCVTTHEGVWHATPCNLPGPGFSVVCEREPAGTRTESFNETLRISLAETAKKKRYLYSPSEDTAEGAVATCKLLGGRLVVFESRAEREELGREIAQLLPPQTPVGTFWIGLAAVGGVFTWDDGTPEAAHPAAWGDQEPKGTGDRRAYMHIAQTSYDSTLVRADDDATARRPFVCERAP
ncbi:MAG: C-type lectin domain-containing protein [Polyangiaceae bacterium]|nr:C-type lectin domain-containing protein [Polyangiaceae bacterium]